jgi:hypothetical protein
MLGVFCSLPSDYAGIAAVGHPVYPGFSYSLAS